MKALLLGATAFATTIVAMVPGVATAQDWSGFYAGFNLAGRGLITQEVTTDVYGSSAVEGQEFIPGLLIGYNLDVGSFVLGAEGDISAVNFSGSGLTSGGASFETELKSLMSARLRAGVKVDRALLFATAGLAAGNTSLATSYDDNGKFTSPSSTSAAGVVTGFTAGGGAEYAVNDNFSFKTDALYYSMNPLASSTADGSFPHAAEVTTTGIVVRGGVNIRLK